MKIKTIKKELIMIKKTGTSQEDKIGNKSTDKD